ncbi:hypothetical protein ACCD10_18240 [Pseudomonas sp. Pseusp122]
MNLHATHCGVDLGELEVSFNAGLWTLEVQLTHPALVCGGFYENLLV